MTFVEVLILGIVEGVTEFLPVSSTGHLILAEKALEVEKSSFLTTFNIAIQLGAIGAVVLLYWRRFLVERQALLRVMVAFVPTAILGLLFYSQVKEILKSHEVVLWSLVIGGVVLMLFETWHGERPGACDDIQSVPLWQAGVVGLCQSVAMVPGVSRSAATVLGSLGLGWTRRAAVEFSFLLAVPTMAAATCLVLYKNASTFTLDQTGALAVGFVVSFVVAVVAIKWLLYFVRTHSFFWFGVYRILAALGFYWVVLR